MTLEIKTISKEIHYIASVDDVMEALKIPDKESTDFISVEYDASTQTFTFKQIEKVE